MIVFTDGLTNLGESSLPNGERYYLAAASGGLLYVEQIRYYLPALAY